MKKNLNLYSLVGDVADVAALQEEEEEEDTFYGAIVYDK